MVTSVISNFQLYKWFIEIKGFNRLGLYIDLKYVQYPPWKKYLKYTYNLLWQND